MPPAGPIGAGSPSDEEKLWDIHGCLFGAPTDLAGDLAKDLRKVPQPLGGER